MNILGSVTAGPANDDSVMLFVPLEHRSWTYTEFLTDLSRYGDLALGGHLGFRDWHDVTLPG
jgi:hypothetical protein